MSENRVFVSQETLDRWLTDEKVRVEADTMTLLPDGQRFRLRTAVHFLSELAGGGDESRLVGKVKDLDQLTALGGEHCADSVVLGDNAYQVIEGFVGESLDSPDSIASGHNLAAATRAAVGEGPPTGELDLLTRFFLSSSSER